MVIKKAQSRSTYSYNQQEYLILSQTMVIKKAQYLNQSMMHGENELLMYSDYSGTCDGWINSDFTDNEKRAVYYIKKTGKGEVLYLNLGHCRGHWDMEPVAEYYPEIEKGSWDKPEYYELLRRGLKYCATR